MGFRGARAPGVRSVTIEIQLRPVIVSDVDAFFEYQRDPQSNLMAAYPARERKAHDAHWAKIMTTESTLVRTIVCEGAVAGHVVSWDGYDGREVGYWLGRGYWGRGIASRALGLFLMEEPRRPLVAHVARHNGASRRVLEKFGFVIIAAVGSQAKPEAEPVSMLTLRLD